MEKVQRKGYEAVLRKVTFPHVSGVLSGVLRQLPGARGRLCGSSGALRGPLPGPGARRLPRWGWELVSLSCWSCWGSLSGLPSHGTRAVPLRPPGAFRLAPALSPRLRAPDSAPVSARSAASSPAPGKPGSSSSSSPSTWSSGGSAPPMKPVSSRWLSGTDGGCRVQTAVFDLGAEPAAPGALQGASSPAAGAAGWWLTSAVQLCSAHGCAAAESTLFPLSCLVPGELRPGVRPGKGPGRPLVPLGRHRSPGPPAAPWELCGFRVC